MNSNNKLKDLEEKKVKFTKEEIDKFIKKYKDVFDALEEYDRTRILKLNGKIVELD